MDCLPRCHAYRRELGWTQSVLTPQTDKMYLKKSAVEFGSLPAVARVSRPDQSVSPRARMRTHTPSTPARARTLSAQRSLCSAPLRPCTRSSLSPAHRFCAGFHDYPDGLMGDKRSRHALLSPHKWARATSTGTGLCLCPPAKAFGRRVALWPTAFEPGPTRR